MMALDFSALALAYAAIPSALSQTPLTFLLYSILLILVIKKVGSTRSYMLSLLSKKTHTSSTFAQAARIVLLVMVVVVSVSCSVTVACWWWFHFFCEIFVRDSLQCFLKC